MIYSPKRRRIMTGAAVALAFAGMAVVIWLSRNHTDPVSIGLFRVVLALSVIGLCARSFIYMDEVQLRTARKHWSLGCMIGIAAMLPVVVFLQTHRPWLDAAVEFFFRHPGGPVLYFSLGVGIPVMFQSVSVVVFALVSKLSRGPQS